MTEATTGQPATGTTAAAPVEAAVTEATAAATAAPVKTEATTAADTAATTTTEKPVEGADKTTRETIAGSTGDDKVAPVQPDWPADWREKLANGDEKFLNKLKRYSSPLDLGGAYRSLEQKLGAGEVKKTLPEGATAEEVTAWKKEQGLPVEVGEYIAKMELPKGMVFGEAEKPLVNSFAEAALKNNWSQAQYNQALGWWTEEQGKIQAAREVADDEFHQKSEDALRGEWGNEYRRNINAVGNILSTLPDEMHIKNEKGEVVEIGGHLLAARLPNGRLLGDHPVIVKWLANQARELNPTATLLPAGAGDPTKGVDGRLKEISELRRTDPAKYHANRKEFEAEEIQLLEAQSKLRSRGRAA